MHHTWCIDREIYHTKTQTSGEKVNNYPQTNTMSFFQEGLKCVPLWIAAWYLAAGIFPVLFFTGLSSVIAKLPLIEAVPSLCWVWSMCGP